MHRQTSRLVARREELMKKFATAFLAGVAMSFALSAVADAKDKTIAVSWKTFQEERWKTDEAAIKAVVEAAGNKFVSTDAQGSPSCRPSRPPPMPASR
jgi:D-xylose transport system substrate-binding protein